MEQNPNVAIRLVEKDNVIKFALVDYVMAITCRSRHDSYNLVCNSLKSVVNGEKANKLVWDKHKFPGSGQRDTWVVTIKEATSYLQCLPHKYTQDVLDYIENQFFRVTGGDPSLHVEIENNSQSNHPIAQAARHATGVTMNLLSDDNEIMEPALKKRHLMLELDEREVVVMKKKLELFSQMSEPLQELAIIKDKLNLLARMPRGMKAHFSKVFSPDDSVMKKEFALKEQEFILKERSFALSKMNREHVIETFNVIKDLSGGAFDSREQQLYKDIMLNSVMPRGQQMITNGDEDITKEITTVNIYERIKEVVKFKNDPAMQVHTGKIQMELEKAGIRGLSPQKVNDYMRKIFGHYPQPPEYKKICVEGKRSMGFTRLFLEPKERDH